LSAEALSGQSPSFTDEYLIAKLEAGDLVLDGLLDELESRCIRIALEKYNNNISKAAEALHVNRTTLYSRVQKLGKL
jgi:DNA-binding NtrC family response regulator